MKWKIVTDSGANSRLNPQITQEVGFEVVPLLVNIGTELFIDNDIEKVSELIEKMENSKLGSSSACPAPDTYAKAFADADNVICFTLSSGLSGSYNSALLAKETVLEQDPTKNIFIFDSLSAGAEVDLLINKAVELVTSDVEFDNVVELLKAYHNKIGLVFMLESVDNLVKNGRLNKLVGSMIGLLGIRLIGERNAVGQIDVIHKSKGLKRALKTLVEELTRNGFDNGKVIVSHCLNETVAQEFKTLVLAQYPQATVEINQTSGLCSYYAQRGGLMIGYQKA
ncbi:DegV family protein [Tuanshanicoccus lijuaniae]|uniref:DegV family protein n=1 Tax=Aerococcaceae bacterium zg-1292 TaxID=2774330 RepID=UPI001935583E|nr:DegV family protein [Aerococcaceae bacterium zg-1292]MBS4456245.1 DegV family protein [Aerococcaceae bacterium zg-A91]MBS4458168.1 DegV family protein [Aerococcaceae bacterium zg-BR33]QQA37597.1 DegV family protein [Aerococcaceae bacterium zg-1292]